jgi:16S rRNA processing protein RimM
MSSRERTPHPSRRSAPRHPLPQGERVSEPAEGLGHQPQKPARVLVARIGAAQGLRGEVRLWTFTAEPTAIREYGPLEAEDGRRFTVESLRPGKGFFVARLAGIGDRNAAEMLRNINLYVARSRLPKPEADEFYHTDLIGLSAVTPEGRPLGTVIAVHDFGAGDLIEIRPESGQTLMVPFTAADVPVVDLAAGRLVVDPPDGLLPSAGGGADTPEA